MSAADTTDESAELLYGVAGWSYADWEGVVYPSRASGEAKMLAVASACDLLEVNTSFYATPKPGVTAAWARRLQRAALPNRLVIKLNRVFTHEPEFTPADVQAVREALEPLDDDAVIDANGVEQPRLLALLIQFPYTFRLTPENSQRIERLAAEFADWTKIIELRHGSWGRPVAYDWLTRQGFCLANIDLPAGTSAVPRHDEARAPSPPENAFPPKVVATGPVGYLRLHGRNAKTWFDRRAPVDQKYNYLYTPEELNDLVDRIRELARRTRTVAVVGNNHYRGKALATVLNLAHLLEGRRAKLPPAMLEEYPHLRAFADAAEPIRLPPPKRRERSRRERPGKAPPPPERDKDNGQLRLFE